MFSIGWGDPIDKLNSYWPSSHESYPHFKYFICTLNCTKVGFGYMKCVLSFLQIGGWRLDAEGAIDDALDDDFVALELLNMPQQLMIKYQLMVPKDP
jgi:hypothetical protein